MTNQLRSSPNTTKTPKKAHPTRVSCVKQPSQRIHPPSRAATRIEGLPHSPNATDILADLIRIGALQLAEFGVSLDLEVHLLAVLRQHLQQMRRKNIELVSRMFGDNDGKALLCTAAEGDRPMAPDLDVNGRVRVLSLWLDVILSSWLLGFGHVWFV